MSKFKLVITALVLVLVLPFTLVAQNVGDEVQQLKDIYEKVQKEYWELKQQNFREREQLNEKLENIDNVLKSSYERRNSITEELFLLEENLKQERESLQNVETRNNELKGLVFETINDEVGKVGGLYPQSFEQATINLNQIKTTLDRDVGDAIDEFIVYKKILIKDGETIEVYRTKIINNQNQSELVTVLRAGFVHSSYYGEDTTGILLRENSLQGASYKWFTDLPNDKSDQLADTISTAINNAGGDGYVDTLFDSSQSGSRLRTLLTNSQLGIVEVIIQFFINGGILMYPLLIVLLVGVFLVIERIWFYKKFNPSRDEEVSDTLIKLIADGEVGSAEKMVEKIQHPSLNKLLFTFFDKKPIEREDAENLMQSSFESQLSVIEKGLSTLGVLAAIAPLLGLLGTVTGMIELFNVITEFGSGNPRVLASGISIALITTQAGLGIAIPIIVIHHFLVRKKNNSINKIDEMVGKVISSYYEYKANNAGSLDTSIATDTTSIGAIGAIGANKSSDSSMPQLDNV